MQLKADDEDLEELPPGRGRPPKDRTIHAIHDAFIVFPIEELMRARGLSAHAACRIVAARLHRKVSWSTHWKRYQRAKKRSPFRQRTLREFLSQLSTR